MINDCIIQIGADNKPFQTFNGKNFKLQPGEKYFNNGSKRMHIFVWEFHNGKRPKGFHVHHKDENKWNNTAENLELKAAGKHISEHVKKRFKDNPELIKKFVENTQRGVKEWRKTPQAKEQYRRVALENNFGRPDLPIQKCQQCKNDFKPISYGTKFCSVNCKQKSIRDNPKNKVTRICTFCHKDFNVYKHSKSTHCSQKCAVSADWIKKKAL